MSKLSLSVKLWLLVVIVIIISIVFAYSLSTFLYERLYVSEVNERLEHQAEGLAADYTGGKVTNELIEKAEWLNGVTDSETFVVNNPRELSACLPFGIDYDSYISEEEREQLLQGETIHKTGYEDRFDRSIVAVIIPLTDEERLEGIVYSYVTIESIDTFIKDFTITWGIAVIIFVAFVILFITKWLGRMIKPLKEIERAANQVSKGNYDIQVESKTNDEVGKLAASFNTMAASIHNEEKKKREFLENVSHELRTPLSYVKGYSHALLDGIAKDENEEKKYLQLISREAGRMQKLISDLFELSKSEREQSTSYREKNPIALAQFMEDVLSKYCLVFSEKQLQLNVELDPDPIIEAEEGKLEQILQNVIDNAVKYTMEKGAITVRLHAYSDTCEIEISDTGIGIPKEDLPHVMNRFYRVNKARTREDGGSGLGLSITKKFVEQHHGSITIQSEYEKGTTVKIIFPTI